MSGYQWINKADKKLESFELPHSYISLLIEAVFCISYQEFLQLDNVQTFSLDYLLNQVCTLKEPINHIIGFDLFYNRKFIVNKNVLIPRVETEFVVYTAINEIKTNFSDKKRLKILDLCCGSGIIGISTFLELSNKFEVDLTLSDISKDALKVCIKNLERLNVDARVIESDYLEEFINKEKFDIILSNPPYIPFKDSLNSLVIDFEPRLALFGGEEGFESYEAIIRQIEYVLNSKYLVVFEIGHDQGEDLRRISEKSNLQSRDQVLKDLFKNDRVFIMKNEE